MRTEMSFADDEARSRGDDMTVGITDDSRQFNHRRKLVLLGLVTLGSIVMAATCIFIFAPDVLRDMLPTSTSTQHLLPAANATSSTLSGKPSIAGHYVLSDTTPAPLILDLQQFGTTVTGTLTAQSCSAPLGQAAVTLVTGHFIDDTTLDLTLSRPEDPHSTHIVYTLAATNGGFMLRWNNSSGHQQSQRWLSVMPQQVRTPLITTCTH